MSKRIPLPGLKASDYIHPQEAKMKIGDSGSLVSKGLDILNDINVSLVKRITLGRHIEVTEKTAPELYNIVQDVCRILDYAEVPRVYVCHQAAQTLCCAGTDRMQITVADYIVEQFDEDMLYFAFGNLISMFKGGHVKLVTVCSMMMTTPKTLVFELPIKAYLRAADLSSDRGGLLACQNFSAAAKFILWNAGIPLSEMEGKSEKEMISLSEAYIAAVERISPDMFTMVATDWRKYNMDSMPPAYQMRELLDWYQTSYGKLISRWMSH